MLPGEVGLRDSTSSDIYTSQDRGVFLEGAMLLKDFMSVNITPLYFHSTLLDAVRLFESTRSDTLPVLDNDHKIFGVFTKRILYRALIKGYSLDFPVVSLATRNIVTVGVDDNFAFLKSKLIDHKVSSALVVDANNNLAGIISKVDLLKMFQRTYETYADDLSSVVMAVRDGVLTFNNDGIITVVNKVAEDLLGINAPEIIGKPVQQVLPGFLLISMTNNGIAPKWQRVEISERTIMVKCFDLIYRNEVTGTLAILCDLTEFEQIVQELDSVKRLQKTLETVLELAYDGIIVIDGDGVVTIANKNMGKFLGIDSNHLVGKKVQSLLRQLKLQDISESRDAFTTQAPYLRLIKIRDQKCLITSQPIVDSDRITGRVIKVMFHGIDQLQKAFLEIDKLKHQVNCYKEKLFQVSIKSFGMDDIIGSSNVINNLKEQARQVAKGISTVLLLGESGTGKELFARAIHNESGRKGNFVKVNCAAIPDNLLESEFFGYTEGAFTGAKKGGKPGKFELAEGGTLFFDEIGDMSLILQAKLLRVLQDYEFERLGGIETIKVNVRLIAATNKNLEELIKQGSFREDLYHRLNVIPLRIPPLRERREDIICIAEFLIHRFNKVMGTRIVGISPDAMAILYNYNWPGNVRELENTIERIMNFSSQGMIEVDHLSDYLKTFCKTENIGCNSEEGFGFRNIRENSEREAVLLALKKAKGNKSKAAKLLRISRSTFYLKLSKYKIS